MPKQFAFFLPQFHTIPENDEWWGTGFTEWTNVKKAKPLYKGHLQPNLPLKDNYYNLLDKKTVEWQTELMHRYHLDGMIYYHYYFNGKKLLEKPAENLLDWKDISQPFFFCWANHSWYRSWEGSKKILLKQEYGNKDDWERHFQYLLPFFRDKRYEKRNNKPLFMIFDSNFPEKEEMFAYFNERCKDNGFDGICLIETWRYNEKGLESLTPLTEFLFAREPEFSVALYRTGTKMKWEYFKRNFSRMIRSAFNKRKPLVLDGNRLYEEKCLCNLKNSRLIFGTFFSWDNTPRHGSRGYVITPPKKEIYMKFMDSVKNEEYIFINAWNEWAEGMILEPTKNQKYKYLEWIAEWVNKQNG